MNRPPRLFYMARYLIKGLFKILLNIKVEGEDNIPDSGSYILISNHLNWSDPFYIYSIFPPSPRIIFVAEYEGVYDTPLKRKFINLMGKPIIPINRKKIISRGRGFKKMYKVVKRGEVLAVFPEGRLGHKEGELFPFHIGVFSLAKKLDVPILPVAIAGSKRLSFRKPIKIKIGDLTRCKIEESAEDYGRRMAKQMQVLLPDYPGDGPYPHIFNWMTNLCQGDLRPFEGENTLIIEKRSQDWGERGNE